jgi:hypothetical protein
MLLFNENLASSPSIKIIHMILALDLLEYKSNSLLTSLLSKIIFVSSLIALADSNCWTEALTNKLLNVTANII